MRSLVEVSPLGLHNWNFRNKYLVGRLIQDVCCDSFQVATSAGIEQNETTKQIVYRPHARTNLQTLIIK